ALTADIETAFLMISVSERDRDVLHFLWVKDTNEDSSDYMVLRFARVVFGVSCSPFLLNATVEHHLELHQDSHKSLVNKLKKSFYADDVITGARTEEEAYSHGVKQTLTEVRSKYCLIKGRMFVRKEIA
uniref:Reverse transcriptase domain-containing protein n=1 Tax=Amphimedon queenslandica TaxID=400682 RepID=A0A1X7UEZ4_AMPQE